MELFHRRGRKLCGHCGRVLTLKAYKEHKRLYYCEGEWLDVHHVERSRRRSSSPLDVSSVLSGVESQASESLSHQHCELDDESEENGSTDSELEVVETMQEAEHWMEDDEEIDLDSFEPSVLSHAPDSSKNQECAEDTECQAIVWWVVAFTCIFQTLHSLSLRAIQWLLLFLATLLSILGKFSSKIAKIAHAFPSTLYLRKQYLRDLLLLPVITYFVVCTACHSLYEYPHCVKKVGACTDIQSCTKCLKERKNYPLLKRVLTSRGSEKFYPFRVYPYSSLISALQPLFMRPDFLEKCLQWRHHDTNLYDVFDGQIWNDYFISENSPFFNDRCALGLMLNIDWFQPFKHRIYSIGVVYLAIMNLPRNLRFKRENIIIVGLIPGPSEPPKHINTYLTPLVSDLLRLWNGVEFSTFNAGSQVIRCALLSVVCDLPAGRKVCGFLSFSANLGCSRCYTNFGTSSFHVKQNYSGFDRQLWIARSNEKHRCDVQTILDCTTKSLQKKKESELGCRYSCLIELPYFDPVRMLTIDPMRNLYLGTAKRVMQKVWLERVIINSTAVIEVNKRIGSMDVPPNVTFSRLPSTIQSCSSFTAEQWMVWTNYYSLFCLYELIPLEHLRCWQYFVLASRVFSKQPLSEKDVSLGDGLLLQFCRRFQSLYGGEEVTPNMHMHCHLAQCMRDYGPMASFWLFSFERYNGILGLQPTNNQSIELQLMKRFTEDNAHMQLLSIQPNCTSEVSEELSRVVVEQALQRDSLKHLDQRSCTALLSTSGVEYIPAKKYTLAVLPESEMCFIKDICGYLYPLQAANTESDNVEFQFPSTYKKMNSITFNNQQFRARQYIHAKSMFPFVSSDSSPLPTSTFFDSTVRPAYIHHFAVYTFQHAGMFITHPFAHVSWLVRHPLQHAIGKPFQIWCYTMFENSPVNFFIPLENIRTILISAEHAFEDEKLLVITPL